MLCNALQLNHEVRFSMPNKGLESHAAQATRLHDAVFDSGKDQFIFVAHSQGGLVSRRAAQQFYAEGRQNMVRGVITIGTPHQGANIARSLQSPISPASDFFNSTLDCPVVVGACGKVNNVIYARINQELAAQAASAAAADLLPGSAAIVQVNVVSEAFQRFGIQHYIPHRWAWARVGGDAVAELGGKKAVDLMRGIYSLQFNPGVVRS